MVEITDPVARAKSIVGLPMPYELGAGDYDPLYRNSGPQNELVSDLPWTHSPRGILGCDCSGFAIAYCHRMHRNAPGFNAGGSVTDAINTTSSVEDALGKRTRFSPVIAPFLGIAQMPQPGDLLVYATIYLKGHPNPWIGHVSIILAVDPAFDPANPDWRLVTVAQCYGPDGREPAVEITNGLFWYEHDRVWGYERDGTPVLSRRSVVIRPNPPTSAPAPSSP